MIYCGAASESVPVWYVRNTIVSKDGAFSVLVNQKVSFDSFDFNMKSGKTFH